jgi:competence protein ComGC
MFLKASLLIYTERIRNKRNGNFTFIIIIIVLVIIIMLILQGVPKKSFTILFHMIQCGECCEKG